MRANIHLIAHIMVPLLTAIFFYRKQWLKIFAIMMLSMLVDLDHLFADPVYDPNRCSIGYHPLHSFYVIPLYFLLLYWKGSREFAIGLLIHMGLDGLDCGLMS